ncbi:MAG: hypothetical protein H6741_32555, partial [Alphaproteobacteria bacterium]|nr:hypothetical protein [Alphaproteobacteria bacterium]
MGPSDPKQELIALIADTFTVESLREFVRRGNKGADIEGRMSWAWAGLKELSAEFLEEAEKAKELHAELFSRVAAHAPHRVDEIVHLAEQLGHPWAPSVRALVLSGLLLEALPEDAQLALLPDIEQHLEKLGARPLAIRQAIGTRDTSNRINPRFFQSLLTQLPEHEATLTRVAALWQIDLRAPPPPPIKQMAQEALPIDLTDAPPSDPRHPAVLVLGSASVFPDHVARAAAAVGQALADLQLSLVTGDSSGVDLGVTRAFANRSRALGQPLRLLKVVTPSWPVTFEGGETLRRPDAAEASVARAALVLVFHGGDGTRQLHALAESMGKPILPLAATGPFAQELFDAQRAAGRLPGRLDARAFASLQELPEPGRFAPLLRRALPVAPGVAADHQPRRAPLTSDRPDQHEDLLDLASQARIFAEALSAKEVRPPLAIGLLGEWGSGKSFFMRQMQQQVRALTQSGDEAFHENVCQVEFNAWHYVDANPWASLAGRIFDGLAEHLFGSAQDQLEAKREALRARLVSTQTEERAARERHSEWQRRLEEARKRLHALEAAQQRYVRSAEVLLDRRVWQTVAERDSIGQLRGKAE